MSKHYKAGKKQVIRKKIKKNKEDIPVLKISKALQYCGLLLTVQAFCKALYQTLKYHFFNLQNNLLKTNLWGVIQAETLKKKKVF